jgi:oxalate decarboxylase
MPDGELAAICAMKGDKPPDPFTWSLAGSVPLSETNSGKLQVVDSSTFRVSTTIASTLVTMKPGALRQVHWHPNADQWQYYIKGKARMGVADALRCACATAFPTK